MIEIDGLTKRYGDKTAVDGLSFVVEPGVVTGSSAPTGRGTRPPRSRVFDIGCALFSPRPRWVFRRRSSGRQLPIAILAPDPSARLTSWRGVASAREIEDLARWLELELTLPD